MELKNIYEKGRKYIDYKIGTIGAGIMATWVFGANINDGGFVSATKSSCVQAAYTFLFGGFVMKSCERFATEIKNKKVAIASSIIIPPLLTISAIYGIHNIIGTKNPEMSTAPSLLAIPACAVMGPKKRKDLEQITLMEENKK